MQDLYILANEIRKDFKKVAFVRNYKVNIMDGRPDRLIQIEDRRELPNMNKIKSMEEYVPDRLKNFDNYVNYIDSAFDAGIIITDMALLLCADRIAESLYIGDCYYYFGVMHIYGKEYRHKLDLYDALPICKQSNPLTLKDLVLKATHGVYLQGNRAVVLDNVAYVAKSYVAYLERPKDLGKVKMYGYIHQGEINWVDIQRDAFVDVKVEGDKIISILNRLNTNTIDAVLRKKSVLDLTGVREYPYPIAILEDGELSYYVKERKNYGNLLFRKSK